MLKKMLMAVAMSAITATSFANGSEARSEAKQVIDLNDGSTVYIFKDGKMAMEGKSGHATRMKEGTVMVSKEGQKIAMQGDEVVRLELLLHNGNEY